MVNFIKYSEIVNENLQDSIIELIKNGKETRSFTLVDNVNFELKYNDMGDYFILLWINIKPNNKYTGLDVFKAFVKYAQQQGAHEITSYAGKGIMYKKEMNGFYTLIKWGFECIHGINFVNNILGTKYKSWKEARDDSKFLPRWKTEGDESDVVFDLTPKSLSMKTLNKL